MLMAFDNTKREGTLGWFRCKCSSKTIATSNKLTKISNLSGGAVTVTDRSGLVTSRPIRLPATTNSRQPNTWGQYEALKVPVGNKSWLLTLIGETRYSTYKYLYNSYTWILCSPIHYHWYRKCGVFSLVVMDNEDISLCMGYSSCQSDVILCGWQIRTYKKIKFSLTFQFTFLHWADFPMTPGGGKWWLTG